jgi:hypothetical protein
VEGVRWVQCGHSGGTGRTEDPAEPDPKFTGLQNDDAWPGPTRDRAPDSIVPVSITCINIFARARPEYCRVWELTVRSRYFCGVWGCCPRPPDKLGGMVVSETGNAIFLAMKIKVPVTATISPSLSLSGPLCTPRIRDDSQFTMSH